MKLCSKYLRRFYPHFSGVNAPEVNVLARPELTIRDSDLVYVSSLQIRPDAWQIIGPSVFKLEENDVLFHFTPVDTRVYVRFEDLHKILTNVKALHDAALHQGFDIKPRLIEAMIEAYGIARVAQLVYEGGDWLKNEIARVEKSLL